MMARVAASSVRGCGVRKVVRGLDLPVCSEIVFTHPQANLFLTGRRRAPVEAVAKDIASAGGSAEAAEVDALDERGHLQSVIDKTGRVDISFNAVGIPDTNIVGVPLAELDAEQFSLPITAYTTSYFLTARLAARHMIPKKSGVIMTVTALLSRTGTALVGGYGPAQAAKEALTRDLSAELAPQGIRVVGLRPHGIPETDSLKEAFEPRQGIGDDLGPVARVARKQDPHATADDARGDGECGGLHGFR
jgi:NAD(P)-dependent dehydrogenase (short-subunit alcohol dehydrogenase family)